MPLPESKKVLETVQKKTVNSFIDVIVLSELSRGSMSGYALIKSISKKFDVLVSSGTVYSHLYALERQKAVAPVNHNQKRDYGLTNKGTEYLELSLKSLKTTFGKLEQNMDKK